MFTHTVSLYYKNNGSEFRMALTQVCLLPRALKIFETKPDKHVQHRVREVEGRCQTQSINTVSYLDSTQRKETSTGIQAVSTSPQQI